MYDAGHVPAYMNADMPAITQSYAGVRDLVGKMESRLPDSAMVYELPYTVFLNESATGRMQPYDPGKPYLVSRHLRWSYPALSNAQVRREESLARLTPEQLLARLISDGFTAILVDRYGYEDGGEGMVQHLRSILGPSEVIAEDPRYVAFNLSSMRKKAAEIQQLSAPSPKAPELLPPCDYPGLGHIDQIGRTSSPSDSNAGVVDTSNVAVAGWAVDRQKQETASFVDIIVDGTVLPAQYGIDRTDVAASFHMPNYRRSGFVAFLPVAQLGLGPHRLALRIASPDKKCVALTPEVPFTVK
jgi:hypothetical protein